MMRQHLILTVAVFTLFAYGNPGFSAPAVNQSSKITKAESQLSEALQAYKNGDYEEALHYWKPLAERGNAKAQNNLGTLYKDGLGVPPDYIKALYWFRKATKNGDPNGQYNLGVMYGLGQVVEQDLTKAKHLFMLAAMQGQGMAQYNLGLTYLYGAGGPQDFMAGHEWIVRAAEQGVEPAISFLRKIQKASN